MEEQNNNHVLGNTEMDEKEFWTLLERSRRYSSEINKQNNHLESLISDLSPKEIVGFNRTMERLFDELGDSSVYYNEFDDEDKYPEEPDHIKYLIISLGEKHYYAVKQTPDYLFYLLDYDCGIDNLHIYAGIDRTHSVFYKKTNQSLRDITLAIDRLEELEQDHKEKQEQDQELEP
ncbi:DUF4240 domain-containing protein [Muricauda sp. SCSIO 64092]|uniref:DUF4240 domain-containing protein n=1 Tax=Allomuricauda sp. SCSIO 64092 TaxID=2908842 RepID=UPI001FF5F26C|nr:DUF4240 domain-containing protein [Muricauda sp. SCSIO 64092]UOY05023.1 DUF4240 domain-containing protein [Muricauda sp. SCSIO 64092]